ncbi:MAG: hypothetical protein AAB378_01985 [Patescibacteria group bacterium]
MRIIGVLFFVIFLSFYGLASAEPGVRHQHGSGHGQVSPQTDEFVYGYSEEDIEAFRQFLTSKRLGLLNKAAEQASSLKNAELRQKAYTVMVYELVRMGDVERAERFAAKVTNHELKWRAYYVLAVEGYAPSGNMPQAWASAETSMTALAELTGVASSDRAGSEMIATQRDKLTVAMLVARIETGDYGEEVLSVFGRIQDKSHYWLMAVEQSVLRLSDRPRVEKFLAFMDYELCEPSEEELTRPDVLVGTKISDLSATYYRNTSRDLLIAVKYGLDEEVGESAFIVYSVLTPEQALDRKDTQ